MSSVIEEIMASRVSNLVPLQEMSKEDIIDYDLRYNEEMTKDIELITYKLKTGEVFEINKNLLTLVEDMVVKTLKRIEENNTKVNKKIGRTFLNIF